MKISDVVILLIDNVSTTPPGHVSTHDSLGLPSIHPNGLTGFAVVVVVAVVVEVIVITSTKVNHTTMRHDSSEMHQRSEPLQFLLSFVGEL